MISPRTPPTPKRWQAAALQSTPRTTASVGCESAIAGRAREGGMELDPTACYQALRSRDRRFDGRFFVAVRTTGIYCRPICPARTPGESRCIFFASAAEAEREG